MPMNVLYGIRNIFLLDKYTLYLLTYGSQLELHRYLIPLLLEIRLLWLIEVDSKKVWRNCKNLYLDLYQIKY